MANKEKKTIRGAGGGGGGGGHTPVEASDTLRSKQIASIIDVISEGPISGLVNGIRSIYFNDIPLGNIDGTQNYSAASAQWRNGLQNQEPLTGFPDVEVQTVLNQEILYGVPVYGHLSDPSFTSVRVTISTPVMTQQEDDGDLVGASASIQIFIQADGAGYPAVPQVTDTIAGKTTSKYPRDYLITLPPSTTGTWDIKVVRTTPDSTSIKLQNNTIFDGFTGIIDARLTYPNTALVGVKLDASQFTSIPNRAYHIKGLIVRVPSNYTPAYQNAATGSWTPAVYSGVWDGTFKLAWTSNPAWCWYDLITAKRYGLGEFVDESSLDKWSLYSIARYCDEMVPSGYSTMEPRFTCNLYLQTREDALTVVRNIAAIFRTISYWGASSIFAMQDAPADPVALFTNANVIDGEFTYSGTSVKQRHTVALVSWNDPQDMYRQKIEYVEDVDAIKEFGVIETNVTAMGCSSRGQARRMGRWILATEKYAAESISFRCGMDNTGIYPGAIINTSDLTRAEIRMGGRILAVQNNQLITLDQSIVIEAGHTYTIKIVSTEPAFDSAGNPTDMPKIMVHTVTSPVGSHDSITISPALSSIPQRDAVFIIAADNVNPESWRVLNVSEQGDGILEVGAITFEPGLYDYVDRDQAFTPLPISVGNGKPPSPINPTVVASRYLVDGVLTGIRATFSWESKQGRFIAGWRKLDESWNFTTTYSVSLDVANVSLSDYEFQVIAVSAIGVESDICYLAVNIADVLITDDVTLPPIDSADPLNPVKLQLEAPFTGKEISVKWQAVKGATGYEVNAVSAPGPRSPSITLRRQVNVGNALRFQYNYEDMTLDGGPWREIYIRVRALGPLDAVSLNYSEIKVTNPQMTGLENVVFSDGVGCVFFSCQQPVDIDFAGIVIYMSDTSGFTPGPTNIVYSGSSVALALNSTPDGRLIEQNVPYFFRVAAYDTFGKDLLTVSAEFTAQSRPVDSENPMKSIGVFPSAPDPELYDLNSIYTNSVNGNAYILQLIAGSKAWVLFVKAGDPGSEVQNPITAFLSNEVTTFATDSDGNYDVIPPYLNGIFRVFEGTTEVTGGAVTYYVESSDGMDISINAAGVYSVTAVTKDTARAVLYSEYASVPISKTYTISKSKAGVNPKFLVLSTSSNVFKYDALNEPIPEEQSITLTGYQSGMADNQFIFRYTLFDASGTPLGDQEYLGTGSEIEFPVSLFGLAQVALVYLQKTEDGTFYEDVRTIVRIQDGVSPQVLAIVADSLSFLTDKSGNTSPASIPMRATRQNLEGTIQWRLDNTDGTLYTGSSWTLLNTTGAYTELSKADNEDVKSITVTVFIGSVFDRATVHHLIDGVDSITGYLTNEVVTLPASSTGEVGSYADAKGTFNLFNGITPINPGAVTYDIDEANTTPGITASINGMGQYEVTDGMDDVAAAYITLTGSYEGAVISKVFSVAKSIAGEDGLTAPTLMISATSQLFLHKANGTVSPAISIISAAQQHLTGYPTFDILAGTVTGMTFPVTGVNSFAFADANMVSEFVTIRASNGTVTDSITISKAYDGSDALSGYLTNESVTLPAASDGSITSYAGASGVFKVFFGTQDVTGSCAFALASSSGIDGTVPVPTNVSGAYSLASGVQAGAASASITWNATYQGKTIQKVFNIGKSKAGAPGSPGSPGSNGASGNQSATAIAYQWGLSAPTASGSTIWFWSSGSYSSAPSGWSATIPTAPANGYTLYEVRVPLAASADISSSLVNWSTGAVVAVSRMPTNGSNGSTGPSGPSGSSARICYCLSNTTTLNTSPTTVSRPGSSYPATGTWGEAFAWQATSPTPSAGQAVFQCDGLYDPVTNTTVWNVPYLSNLKVGSLSALSANLGTVTAGSLSAVTISTVGATTRFNVDSSGLLTARRPQMQGLLIDWDQQNANIPSLVAGNASSGVSTNPPIDAISSSAAAAVRCSGGASGPALSIVGGANGIVQTGGNGANYLRTLAAASDNAYSCGTASFRWTQVFAATSTISTSDPRAKFDIQHSPLGLSFINRLRPVTFKMRVGHYRSTYDSDGNEVFDSEGKAIMAPVEGERDHSGFLSTDVKAALDAEGAYNSSIWSLADKDDPDSMQALRYEGFVSPLVAAVQELSRKNDQLEETIASLLARLDAAGL